MSDLDLKNEIDRLIALRRTSPFVDDIWLRNSIVELMQIQVAAAKRAVEDRCEKIAKERGWVK